MRSTFPYTYLPCLSPQTLAFFVKELYSYGMLLFACTFRKKYLPQRSPFCCAFVTLSMTLCLLFCLSHAAQASSKKKEHSAWDALESHNADTDAFWKKSVSGDAFLQKKGIEREVKDTGREAREKYKAEHPKKGNGITFGSGVMSEDADAVGKQVAPPSAVEHSLDDTLHQHTHDVYGAYKEVVQQEDLKVRMGPEVRVPANNTEVLNKGEAPKASDVGVGMKLKWDF